MQLEDSFVAIDFETADHGRDSACAIGLVRVEHGEIAGHEYRLIRPPRREFVFTYIHGITWEMVAEEPTFGELWPILAPWILDTPCLVAHNAGFDRSVLRTCSATSGVELPAELRFECSMQIARRVLKIYPTSLDRVCQKLGIRLNHHNALSDAEASARIILEAQKHLAGVR